MPARAAGPSFIVAGGGEAPEGKPNYRDHIVRLGDTSREGMREKIRYVMAHGAGRGAVEWHFTRPPVVGIDFEMDVRGAARELII